MIEYALLVTLLFAAGWIIVHGKGNPWVRGLLVVALIFFSVGLIKRVERYRGTPRAATMPAEVVVHGFIVDEDAGIIYLYCGKRPPESLMVPYERGAHEALQQGRQKFGGKTFKMTSKGEGEGEGQGDGEGESGRGNSMSTFSDRTYVVELPQALLPQK